MGPWAVLSRSRVLNAGMHPDTHPRANSLARMPIRPAHAAQPTPVCTGAWGTHVLKARRHAQHTCHRRCTPHPPPPLRAHTHAGMHICTHAQFKTVRASEQIPRRARQQCLSRKGPAGVKVGLSMPEGHPSINLAVHATPLLQYGQSRSPLPQSPGHRGEGKGV